MLMKLVLNIYMYNFSKREFNESQDGEFCLSKKKFKSFDEESNLFSSSSSDLLQLDFNKINEEIKANEVNDVKKNGSECEPTCMSKNTEMNFRFNACELNSTDINKDSSFQCYSKILNQDTLNTEYRASDLSLNHLNPDRKEILTSEMSSVNYFQCLSKNIPDKTIFSNNTECNNIKCDVDLNSMLKTSFGSTKKIIKKYNSIKKVPYKWKYLKNYILISNSRSKKGTLKALQFFKRDNHNSTGNKKNWGITKDGYLIIRIINIESRIKLTQYRKEYMEMLFEKRMLDLPLITNFDQVLQKMFKACYLVVNSYIPSLIQQKSFKKSCSVVKSSYEYYFDNFINDNLLKSIKNSIVSSFDIYQHREKNYQKYSPCIFASFNEFIKNYYELFKLFLEDTSDSYVKKTKNKSDIDSINHPIKEIFYEMISILLNNNNHQILDVLFPELEFVLLEIFNKLSYVRYQRSVHIIVSIIVCKLNYLKLCIQKEASENMHSHSKFSLNSMVFRSLIANVNAIILVLYLNFCFENIDRRVYNTLIFKSFLAFMVSKYPRNFKSSILLSICFLDNEYFESCAIKYENKEVKIDPFHKKYYLELDFVEKSLLDVIIEDVKITYDDAESFMRFIIYKILMVDKNESLDFLIVKVRKSILEIKEYFINSSNNE
ncbi:hypothetical protein TUBRATIS_13620 [Tubulinosema ratisbonensis]|uniref:Uncharacterized protein n=1 Tax=Tubulinosema ratisbonensis TaxID=291195 RepID=A0A437ALP7_9MICR|nr:hypothetical protein TUBRATIS_13620 [Tubulinosema ratisbonensis]